MARAPADQPLPVLRVEGDHVTVGEAIGEAMRDQIRVAVEDVRADFSDAPGRVDAALAQANAPLLHAASATLPWLVAQLRAMASAAGVSFEVLFHLNAGGYRPPAAGGESAAFAAAVEGPLRDASDGGCTSVISRVGGGCVLGHTEDAPPEAIMELYAIDAVMRRDRGDRWLEYAFLGLNYAYTLPGVAASMNARGVAMLIDTLQDAHPVAGARVPADFITSYLLEAESVEDAILRVERIPRSGGWSCLLAQAEHVAAVEVTSRRVERLELDPTGSCAHANHYLHPELALVAPPPRPDSVARLAKARELLGSATSVADVKRLLSDREGYPDSICRNRTIGAFVADTRDGSVWTCWGEPARGVWQRVGACT